MGHFFKDFPPPDAMMPNGHDGPAPEVNAHVHSPYSFSAFPSMDALFEQAREDRIGVLGINDFNTAKGYPEFAQKALENGIFPLFNMEFMGLLKAMQEDGTRVNDPSNPGRTYICGKGFPQPFRMPDEFSKTLNSLIHEGDLQLDAMIQKLNGYFGDIKLPLRLSLEAIRKTHAKHLVRERHMARAIREDLMARSSSPEGALKSFGLVLGTRVDASWLSDDVKLENEIRSRLLKKGGPGYVTESERSFIPVEDLVRLIRGAGGIPCYPVLLDDENGRMTEYEADWEVLGEHLRSLEIPAIELIPPRNDQKVLRSFVEFFDRKDFIVTFGTEHNTPEKHSLTVRCRHGIPLDPATKKIAFRGALIIIAHQYLVSKEQNGYYATDGKPKYSQKNDMEIFGRDLLKWYFRHGVKSQRS
mgnify:CR=1 FL=1